MNKQTTKDKQTINITLKDYMAASQRVTKIRFAKKAVTVQYVNTLNGRKQIKDIDVQQKLINEQDAKEFTMF